MKKSDIEVGDTVVITDPRVSSIPERDRGYQGKVTELTQHYHNCGRLIMLNGPSTGVRWNFRFEGVDVLRGPW